MMSAIAEQHLKTALRLGTGPDLPAFANAAQQLLGAGLRHDGLILLLMRRYAEVGFLHPARRLAPLLSSERQALPDFREMLAALTPIDRDQRCDWRSHRARFESNLAALDVRDPASAEQVREAWRTARERLELYASRDDGPQVFEPDAGLCGVWRPTLGRAALPTTAAQFAAQLRGTMHAPFVLEFVGRGEVLRWAFDATRDTYVGASVLLHVIEPSTVALAAAMHLHDLADVLSSTRVELYLGAGAYEAFEARGCRDVWRPPPGVRVGGTSWDQAPPRANASINVLRRRFQVDLERRRAAVATQYEGRDVAWWRDRFAAARNGEQAPLRVLGLTTRFSTVLKYTLRDALAALEHCGCVTELFSEPEDHDRTTEAAFLEATARFAPDVLLVTDHTRTTRGLPPGMPCLTWVQDCLPALRRRETGAGLGPLDFCFGIGAELLCSEYDFPNERFLPASMPTSERVLAEPQPGDDLREHGDLVCDLAFATNLNLSPEQHWRESLDAVSASERRVLGPAWEVLNAGVADCTLSGSWDFAGLLRRWTAEAHESLDDERRRVLEHDVLRPTVDRLIRWQTLRWAADWAERTGRRFHLYGAGWPDAPEFAPFARGPIAHGPRLGAAFRLARINLHASINAAFHQRVLDTCMAGGFILLRRNPADTGFWYEREAVHPLIRSGALQLGDHFTPSDLPPPWDVRLREQQRMWGLAPDAPRDVTEALIARSMSDLPVTPLVPLWGDLVFDLYYRTQAEFEAQLERFLNDDAARRGYGERMRDAVRDAYSYDAVMNRVLDWLHDRLTHGAT